MVQQITTKAKFDEVLASAGSKLVVVDFYATWCGPCRMIAPFIEELSQKHPDVVFIKVDVDENEETAQVAGISAMPTFHGYRNGERVGEVIGASKDKLVQMIESHKQ